MDINHIRYVMAVAEEKNFSKAAEKLFITQPTLSLQIKKLETELGFPLFVRNTKNVELTSYGKQFVEQAKPVLDDFNQFDKWIVQTRQLRNASLTFGSSAISMPHSGALNRIRSFFRCLYEAMIAPPSSDSMRGAGTV